MTDEPSLFSTSELDDFIGQEPTTKSPNVRTKSEIKVKQRKDKVVVTYQPKPKNVTTGFGKSRTATVSLPNIKTPIREKEASSPSRISKTDSHEEPEKILFSSKSVFDHKLRVIATNRGYYIYLMKANTRFIMIEPKLISQTGRMWLR